MYSRSCQTSKIYYRSLAGFWIRLWGWFWEILSHKGAFRLWTKFQKKFLFQKQSSTVLKNIYVKDFQNILRKSLEVHWLSNYKVRSWFSKNQGMNFYEDSFQAATLLKKWLRYMCFPTNFVKFLRKFFFLKNISGGCFWFLWASVFLFSFFDVT